MKFNKVFRMVASLSFVGALGLFGLTSCSSNTSVDPDAIAATMGDYELKESVVTNYIENFRASQNLTEEDAWGMWLAQYNLTPEAIREESINYFMDMELVKILAEQEGLSVSDEEVDAEVDSMKARYSDEDAFNDALAQAGINEELYRDSVRAGLLEGQLQEKISSEADTTVTDDELIETASQYTDYFNGAKKSSHILFKTEDKETAEKVLEQLKNNEIAFEDAVAQYSEDAGSKEKGGDVGWDMLNSFVEEYTTSLESLEKDQMSDLVESDFGYHIIKVTDVFVAPEELTSIDQIPVELADYLRSMLESSKESEAYTEWFAEQKEKNEVKINDMPKGLPYDVDVTKYQEELESLAEESSVASVELESQASESSSGDGTSSASSGSSAAGSQASSSSAESSSSSSSKAA